MELSEKLISKPCQVKKLNNHARPNLHTRKRVSNWFPKSKDGSKGRTHFSMLRAEMHFHAVLRVFSFPALAELWHARHACKTVENKVKIGKAMRDLFLYCAILHSLVFTKKQF